MTIECARMMMWIYAVTARNYEWHVVLKTKRIPFGGWHFEQQDMCGVCVLDLCLSNWEEKKNTNKIWIQTVFVMRCRPQICMIGTISVKPNNKHKTTKNRYLRKRLPAAFCAESRWKTCPINPKSFHSVCCVIFNRSFFHANRICFSPILCERGRSVCSVRLFAHKLAIKEYFFTKSLSPQSNGAAKRSQCAVNVCDCGFA